MSEFLYSISEYSRIANSLREDILRSKIEIQLMWLFEVLVILTFVRNKDNRKIVKLNKNKNLSMNTNSFFHGYNYKYASILQTLHDYRHAMVHKGFAYASVYFMELKDNADLLNELCKEQLNLYLDFTNRLF